MYTPPPQHSLFYRIFFKEDPPAQEPPVSQNQPLNLPANDGQVSLVYCPEGDNAVILDIDTPKGSMTAEIDGFPCVIGRKGDLALDDSSISDNHAVIDMQYNVYTITALSKKGVKVNGAVIKPDLSELINKGDVITLGKTKITVLETVANKYLPQVEHPVVENTIFNVHQKTPEQPTKPFPKKEPAQPVEPAPAIDLAPQSDSATGTEIAPQAPPAPAPAPPTQPASQSAPQYKNFCPECGRKNTKQKRFCAECGRSLEN